MSVYILVLSGDAQEAVRITERLYPGCEVISLSKRELREGGWKRQLQELRRLKGEAFVVFVDSMEDIQEPLLWRLTVLFHRCRESVIAESGGGVQVLRRLELWRMFPVAVLSVFADAFVFLTAWIGMRWLLLWVKAAPQFGKPDPGLDVAFLYPFPMDRAAAGGAMSHVKGFLSGLAQRSARCEIFSGRTLPFALFPVRECPNRRRLYVFRESVALSYNLRFVASVKRQLASRRPAFVYQRHGRFVVAGALLSRKLRCPLVLEYNGSEVWITKHWDPTRFSALLKQCEKISLAAATLIVVVSEALKQQLMDLGIPKEKILVNPNAVDPLRFHPDCGGPEVRQQLKFQPNQMVVGFIGSFSYWHGVAILQNAIQILLQEQQSNPLLPELRFLLVGDGPLNGEMREALEPYRKKGWVVFTGQVSHDRAPSYLDSADILVSPHVPMPDGRPFFGSPTKLFEYMAMGKAIIASNLDQLARVLTHRQTAWLVEPGNARELAGAIRLLATRPEMRNDLGKNARQAALAKHTWEENAVRVLSRFVEIEPSIASSVMERSVTES